MRISDWSSDVCSSDLDARKAGGFLVMKWTMVLAGALAAPLAMAAAPAQAQEAGHDWFVRAGITQLTLADEIDLTVAGPPIPNDGIDTDSPYTPTFQLGRTRSEERRRGKAGVRTCRT